MTTPITDAITLEAIRRCARSLLRCYEHGEDDVDAREDMCVASLLGGIALANAKLGAVHGTLSLSLALTHSLTLLLTHSPAHSLRQASPARSGG